MLPNLIHFAHWVTCILLLVIAYYCYINRHIATARSLLAVCLITAAWPFISALIYIVPTLEAQILLNRFKMMVVALIPFSFLNLVLTLFWPKNLHRIFLLFFGTSSILFSFFFITPWHEMIITGYQLVEISGAQILSFENGPWFHFYYVHAFTILCLTIILTIIPAKSVLTIHHFSKFFLILAIILPSIVDIISVNFIEHGRLLQLTPASFLITAFVLFRTLARENLLDLIPYARAVIFDNIKDPYLTFNIKKRLIDYNNAAKEILNIHTKDLGTTKDHLAKTHPIDRNNSTVEINHDFYFISSQQLYDHKNNFVGEVITLKNITYQEKLYRNLEKSNTFKTQLISVLAHDLQTNLSGLSLLSRALLNNVDRYQKDETKKEALYIDKAARSAIDFVNNIVDWGKSQLDNFTPHYRHVDIEEATHEVITFLSSLLTSKNITTEIQCSSVTSFTTDREIYKAIIRNILSNAIQVAPKNSIITIKITVLTSALIIEVLDQGPGLSQDELETVQHSPLKVGGQGLGLFICKEFAAVLDGEIRIGKHGNQQGHLIVELPLILLGDSPSGHIPLNK